MTLFDIKVGNLFEWHGDIYRLVEMSLTGDITIAHCIARKDEGGKLYPTSNLAYENFNPYAEITSGEVIFKWEPDYVVITSKRKE